jgi:hypothetical protein
METLLEGCTIEVQRSLARFFLCGQRIQLKECFLLMAGSVYRIKQFTTGSINVANVSLVTERLKRSYGSD